MSEQPKMPLVSVIIPVRNRRAFLREAVQSVLDQNYAPVQIIVVDDGSTDDSVETIKDFSVEILQLGQSGGPSFARNRGMKSARGEFVTFLDSDDRMVQGSIEWRVQWLMANPAKNVVVGRIDSVIDDQGKLLGRTEQLLYPSGWVVPSVLDRQFFALGGQFFFATWSALFRRDFLVRLGPLDEGLGFAHDRELILRIVAQGPVDVVDRGVIEYRWHLNNMCREGPNLQLPLQMTSRRKCAAEVFLVDLAYGLCGRCTPSI